MHLWNFNSIKFGSACDYLVYGFKSFGIVVYFGSVEITTTGPVWLLQSYWRILIYEQFASSSFTFCFYYSSIISFAPIVARTLVFCSSWRYRCLSMHLSIPAWSHCCLLAIFFQLFDLEYYSVLIGQNLNFETHLKNSIGSIDFTGLHCRYGSGKGLPHHDSYNFLTLKTDSNRLKK